MKKFNLEQIKNKKISLVLSGGAAYGIAHLGIIKYLEEKNLKPVEVLGASMGAIVASLYAIGKTFKEIEELTGKVKIKGLYQLKVSLGENKRDYEQLKQFMKKLFGSLKMKDAKIDLKIMTTNVNTGMGKLFTKEDNIYIYEAVLASISVPGLFKPKEIRGVYYIDGGVFSNLPIEYAKEGNIKIACNVINSKKIHKYIKNKNNAISLIHRNLKVVRSTIHYLVENQTNAKAPYIRNLILIEPDLSEFSKVSFQDYKTMIKRGYSEIKKYFRN
jgi:NTE family protein